MIQQNGFGVATILYVLFAHWVADFIFQTDKQAQNKSKNVGYLLKHTVIYSLVMTVFMTWPFSREIPVLGIGFMGDEFVRKQIEKYFYCMFYFWFFTFFFHTITDEFTSKLNSYLWQQKQTHWFFVSVGFDQFLHFVQLFYTCQYLINQYAVRNEF